MEQLWFLNIILHELDLMTQNNFISIPCNKYSPPLPTRSALVLKVLYHQRIIEREYKLNRSLKVNSETDFKCFLRYTLKYAKLTLKASLSVDIRSFDCSVTSFLALCMCALRRGNIGLLPLVKQHFNSQIESLQSVRRWTEFSWAWAMLVERQS